MPTPRAHGGAALQHFQLNLPAFKGLNRQAKGAVLGPEWATRMENTVLDASNRVAARKGWVDQTTGTAITGNVVQMIRFDNAGVDEIIAVTDASTLWKSVNGGVGWTNVTGTATISDTGMALVVFRDKLLGFQDTGNVIIYTGTTFSNLSATSEPTGNVALAAFGRLWVKETATTIKYCALLDETDWTSADAGTIDLTSVWKGQDSITALAEFNNTLVIFSTNNVIIYTDGAGSKLGLDPTQIYVVDTLNGIGCIARDSVVNVKGDLWFLDYTGVHSLGRAIQQKSNPLNNISLNVQDELKGYVQIAGLGDVRAVYSPRDRFYLLSLPSGSTTAENGVAFVFDTRGFLDDGSARCVGIWNQMVPTAMVVRDNLDLISSLNVKTGKVGKYDLYLDDLSTYIVEYESAWTDLQSPELKMLKVLSGLLYVAAATEVTYKWAFDFDDTFKTASVLYPGSGTTSEFNVAEFNIGEFGGGVAIREKRVAGRGTGEHIKVGFTIEIASEEVSCQQLTLYAKQGRLR